MGKSVWMTSSEALTEMHRKLDALEPTTLAIWARDGNLKARAKRVFLSEDGGGSELDNPHSPTARWWADIWYGITHPCTFPDRSRLHWTSGDLVTFRAAGRGFCEELWVQGLEFHRADLTRCIRAVRGEKEPVLRADPKKVKDWVYERVSSEGLDKVTDRLIKSEAKRQFPGLRGAPSWAGKYLQEFRASGETNKTAQKNVLKT